MKVWEWFKLKVRLLRKVNVELCSFLNLFFRSSALVRDFRHRSSIYQVSLARMERRTCTRRGRVHGFSLQSHLQKIIRTVVVFQHLGESPKRWLYPRQSRNARKIHSCWRSRSSPQRMDQGTFHSSLTENVDIFRRCSNWVECSIKLKLSHGPFTIF